MIRRIETAAGAIDKIICRLLRIKDIDTEEFVWDQYKENFPPDLAVRLDRIWKALGEKEDFNFRFISFGDGFGECRLKAHFSGREMSLELFALASSEQSPLTALGIDFSLGSLSYCCTLDSFDRVKYIDDCLEPGERKVYLFSKGHLVSADDNQYKFPLTPAQALEWLLGKTTGF